MLSEIDMSHEGLEVPALSDAYRPGMPADEWLERRTHAWGGSEIGPLMVAYGLAPLDAVLPTWVLEQSDHYQRLGIPKLLAWKGGLRPRTKGDVRSKEAGHNREHELYLRYRAGAAKARVNPKSMRYANTLPREFLPFVDRECRELAVTPDAWARAASDGRLVMIELKCTYKPITVLRAPWHYRCQLQAEIGACGASYGLLVMGEQWIHDEAAIKSGIAKDGPIRVFAFARDDAMIALIRAVATEAWGVVETLRALADESDALDGDTSTKARKRRKELSEQCAVAWAQSRERMQVHADPTRAHIEAALNEIEGLDTLTDFAA